MLMTPLLKRFSLLFIVLSVILWTAKRENTTDNCTPSVLNPPGHAEEPKATVAKWFQRKVQKNLSPTHFTLEPSCLVLNATMADSTPYDADHIGTVSVIGELHLRPGGLNRTLLEEDGVLPWGKNMADLTEDSDYTLTNFPTLIRRSDSPKQLLDALGELGPLVVSLANTRTFLQSADSDITHTTRVLESSGIEWMGVYGKKYHILVIRKLRVGLLAFCGVHKECGGTWNTRAFSPVKYTNKIAQAAVSELKEHGVSVVIVLMHWGLQTSYFPDEMALTVARQLAMLGVSAVLGHHPNSIQDHAYFGNTLVIFSVGKLLSSTEVADYCWNKISGKWEYSRSKICGTIHPNARKELLNREQKSRVYKLHLSKNHPVMAEYVTVQLEDHNTGKGYSIRRPVGTTTSKSWTQVCSNSDKHCLSCQPF